MEVKSSERTVQFRLGFLAKFLGIGGSPALRFVDQNVQTSMTSPSGQLVAGYHHSFPHRAHVAECLTENSGSLSWVMPHEAGRLEFRSGQARQPMMAQFDGGLLGRGSHVEVIMGRSRSEIKAVIPHGTKLRIKPDKGRHMQLEVQLR